MKKVILVIGIVICLVVAHLVFAQVTEGSIIYEVKVNMHRTLPPDRPQMKEVVPEFNIHKDMLLFKGSESLYSPMEDDEQEDEFDGDGGRMRLRIRRPHVEIYIDRAKDKRITQQEFFGKKYLIEDSLKVLPWKFGAESKIIQGYTCKSATYLNSERKQVVKAWYSEQLPPFLGPEHYNSLPGAILELDINEGERVITAKEISFVPLKKGVLKAPSSGQKTTEADFRKMIDEHMRKMGAQGGMIIRN